MIEPDDLRAELIRRFALAEIEGPPLLGAAQPDHARLGAAVRITWAARSSSRRSTSEVAGITSERPSSDSTQWVGAGGWPLSRRGLASAVTPAQPGRS